MPTLETINVGLAPNDKKGDPLRNAMQKVVGNFTKLNEAIQGVLDGKGQANGYASLGPDGRLVAGQVPVAYASALASGVDLDTVVLPGFYHQHTNAGAAAGVNYPTPFAGLLEVYAPNASSSNFVYQFYTRFRGGGAYQSRFWRAIYQTTWSEWVEVQTSQNGFGYGGGIAASQDLNSFTQRGTWVQGSSAGASSGLNYPIAQSGYLIVYSAGYPGGAASTGAAQIYIAANTNRTFFRSLIGTTWSPWEESVRSSLLGTANGIAQLDASGRLLFGQAPIAYANAVLTGTDANSVTEPGAYYLNGDAQATAALNWPISLAGTLTVERALSGNLQITQTYTTRNGTGGAVRTFKRVRFGGGAGTWGTWQEQARFDDAMTHVFLTAAADANTLVADNVFYTWRSGVVVTGGSNWAPVGTNISGGSLEVRVTGSDMIIQTATFLVGSNKPRIYQRFGSGSTWQAWKIISAVSSVTWLPTADAGDAYVDGLGWHAWNGTAYALVSLATVLPTAAHDLNTYVTPGSYRQTSNAGAAAGTNYPSAFAGYLEVVSGASGSCKQEYAIASASNVGVASGPRKFWRMQTGASSWSPWQEVLTAALGMTHQFLTAATDANSLSADNTFYTWTSSTVIGANFPTFSTNWASAGYMRVYWNAATQVCQELTFIVGGQKPRVFARFGNASAGTWQPWKSISDWSSATGLPSMDCGDIYVDGSGTYRWSGSSYAPSDLSLATMTDTRTRLTTVEGQILGRGQTWVDVTASRAGGVYYTNSTGRPILINIRGIPSSEATMLVADGPLVQARYGWSAAYIGQEVALQVTIPPGRTYTADWANFSVIVWFEFR